MAQLSEDTAVTSMSTTSIPPLASPAPFPFVLSVASDPVSCKKGFKCNIFRPTHCGGCGLRYDQHASITEADARLAYYHEHKELGQEIIKGVWLGAMEAAMNEKFLKSSNITCVLTAAENLDKRFWKRMHALFHAPESPYKSVDHVVLPMVDVGSQKLHPHVDKGIHFITSRLEQGQSVLVHCAQGKSRSVSVIMAYLINIQQLSYDEALKHVSGIRPCISPNHGFREQLKEMDRELKRRAKSAKTQVVASQSLEERTELLQIA